MTTDEARADSPNLEPVEIILESEPGETGFEAPLAGALPLAPAALGRRFMAGVVDATALVTAACLFALVFWQAGGHISPHPLSYAVLGFIAAFFVFSYFGLFTRLAARTPGLAWAGLEVRNLDGEYPTAKESLWRAFGYLISMAGLMLGFVWAVLDSEELTWHDRMSGTFLTLRRRGRDGKGRSSNSRSHVTL